MGREYSAILSYLKLTGQELKNAQRSVCKQGRFLEFLKSIHFGTRTARMHFEMHTSVFFCGSTECQHFSAPLSVGAEVNWVCVYPDGCVPLPALRRLLVVSFLGFWLEGLVLLLRHFHHSVLRLLQLSPFLGRAFPSPTHLQTADST